MAEYKDGLLQGSVLGTAASLDVGTTAGSVAAGNDGRFVTNGDTHDHNGGDGAQIAYANISGTPSNSTTTTPGVIEIALDSEAQAGTDTERAITSANLFATENHEAATSASSSSGTLTINLSAARVFSVTLTENVTTFTVSNPVNGRASSFTLLLTQAAAAKTVAWPVGTIWPGGTAPDITTNSSKHAITFVSVDAGTIWWGFHAGANVAAVA